MDCATGPLLLNRRGAGMDRPAATRRLRDLAAQAGVRLPQVPLHLLWHTFVTTGLDACVDRREFLIAARHVDPRTSTATPMTSWPPTWSPAPEQDNGADVGRTVASCSVETGLTAALKLS